MKIIEHVEAGRKYKAYSDGDGVVIIGPPDGLVDEIGLPEPFATRLHNIMFMRGLLCYDDVVRARGSLLGSLQEALAIDVQKLNEKFFSYEKETEDE